MAPDGMNNPRNRVVVITGASRGIGAALAQSFAREGADLGLLARGRAGLGKLAAQLPVEALPVSCDVADEQEIADAFASVAERFGGIDAVVANAGIAPPSRRAHKLDLKLWNQVLEVNLTGTFLTARASYEHLAASGRGRFVTVSSVMASLPRRGIAAYVASKSGVEGLTRALAVDWAADGIAVNAVVPGFFSAGLGEEFVNSERLRRQVLERTPLDRFGHVAELADTIRFLTGDSGGFMTGQTLVVDGGYGMG
jgi:NAD(P)-dependent dehydrogenase (short-subunit alcohol dehydrogenase family)